MSQYQRKDSYYSKAKSEGFRSRAAFKLIELNKRFKLIKSSDSVVDLGCWPGGWLQVAAGLVGSNGCVVGVDLVPVEPLRKHEFKSSNYVEPTLIVGDILDPSTISKISQAAKGSVDVVLSDMSPKLSGIRLRDTAMTEELVEIAFMSCPKMLKNGGSFVCKTFPSAELDEVFKRHKSWFEKLTRVTLDSSRKTSKEYYIIGRNFSRQTALSSLSDGVGLSDEGAEFAENEITIDSAAALWDPFK